MSAPALLDVKPWGHTTSPLCRKLKGPRSFFAIRLIVFMPVTPALEAAQVATDKA
jgi:hypothetical protein